MSRSSTPHEPNLLILYDAPEARVQKHFINQGVIHADPETYLRQYATELNTHYDSSHLVDEAIRAVPPPPRIASPIITDHHITRVSSPLPPPVIESSIISERHTRVPSPLPPLIDTSIISDRYPRIPSPSYITTSRWDYPIDLPRSSSYHYDYSRYDRPYYYSSYRPRYDESYRSMADVTPLWSRYCGSSSYRYPSDVIRVRSEGDFRRVMDDLTHGHSYSRYSSYY